MVIVWYFSLFSCIIIDFLSIRFSHCIIFNFLFRLSIAFMNSSKPFCEMKSQIISLGGLCHSTNTILFLFLLIYTWIIITPRHHYFSFSSSFSTLDNQSWSDSTSYIQNKCQHFQVDYSHLWCTSNLSFSS